MKKKDIVLILVLLAVGMLIIASFRVFSEEESGQVIVTVAGKEYATLPLNKSARIEIEGSYGTNILIVEGGSAKMEEAGCPDQVCVRHKAIRYNGETIICLPNQIIVQIVNGEETPIDSVVQ